MTISVHLLPWYTHFSYDTHFLGIFIPQVTNTTLPHTKVQIRLAQTWKARLFFACYLFKQGCKVIWPTYVYCNITFIILWIKAALGLDIWVNLNVIRFDKIWLNLIKLWMNLKTKIILMHIAELAYQDEEKLLNSTNYTSLPVKFYRQEGYKFT